MKYSQGRVFLLIGRLARLYMMFMFHDLPIVIVVY
jgi:hypothetical protein